MRLDQESFVRGMWPEALVAALATLAVAWPLTALLREDDWLPIAISLVALVAVSGGVLRTLDAPPSVVALGQLLLGLVGITLLFLRDTLWRGVLPTRESLEQTGVLLAQAGTVLQTYSAPAPTTEGVTFLVVSVLTLTAVSVDSMGVTGRAPASAGIPLAAGFMVSVSNTGEAMQPWYFVAVAGLWMLMLAQQGRRVTLAWPSANRREARGGTDVTEGPRSYRGLSQVIGSVALVGAVLGAAALPHLPPTFFAEGLGRNPDARGSGSAGDQVAFTESMDPAEDLRDQSDTPVLTYRATGARLEPLRVTATQRFDDGRWLPPRRSSGDLQPPGAPLPGPSGLRADIPVDEQQVQVLANALQPPHLAAPSPLTSLQTQGGSFRYDPSDSTVVLQGQVRDYTAEYLVLDAAGSLPGDVGSTPADRDQFDPELLALDPASQPAVAALTEEVTGGERNSLSVATAIQDHLRSGRYTYSLELAPPAKAGADDPIGGFLETRRGYCVQFATAMVMMARHEGIPARMAVGFLPGTPLTPDLHEVVAADAHTWPELWIDGLGWTRFEPTPGIRAGSPPAYVRVDEEEPDQAPATQAPEVPEVEPPPAAAPETPQESALDDLRDLLPVIGRTLAVVLLLTLLMVLVPWVGRRHREAGLRGARTPAEQVEGQWLLLTRSLQDLGVEEPPARSPRDMGRYYQRVTVLGTREQQALGRATATLERSRYASPTGLDERQAGAMGEDVRAVVHGVRHGSPWNLRANAALLPRSGLQGLRSLPHLIRGRPPRHPG